MIALATKRAEDPYGRAMEWNIVFDFEENNLEGQSSSVDVNHYSIA